MVDQIAKIRCNRAGVTGLAASVTKSDFGTAVLNYVSQTAAIRNFCVFYFPDLRQLEAHHSIWAGSVGDFWLRLQGSTIVNDTDLIQPMLEEIQAVPIQKHSIGRGSPSKGDPAKPIYERFGICERVTVASRNRKSGFMSFFLRSESDGWLSDEQFQGLRETLPLVHEMVGLRHRIIGSENFQYSAGVSASSLRERQVMEFASLSQREAEVCDCIVSGLSVVATAAQLGIAEATVKELRRRAYKKLNVHSAAQMVKIIALDSSV